jgi:signal transduction histidine kinase
MYHHTGVEFIFKNKLERTLDVKVPGDYSRNILMIFKEAMSNVLKHAEATQVVFTVENLYERGVCLTLKDNGKGFQQELIKEGNGLPNMIKRAKRIDADFSVNSMPSAGTEYRLLVKIPQ